METQSTDAMRRQKMSGLCSPERTNKNLVTLTYGLLETRRSSLTVDRMFMRRCLLRSQSRQRLYSIFLVDYKKKSMGF